MLESFVSILNAGDDACVHTSSGLLIYLDNTLVHVLSVPEYVIMDASWIFGLFRSFGIVAIVCLLTVFLYMLLKLILDATALDVVRSGFPAGWTLLSAFASVVLLRTATLRVGVDIIILAYSS